MQSQPLNPKQRKFLRLYLGRDDRYLGNATKCYMLVYDCESERVAQTSGSRLLKNPVIAGEIALFDEAQQNAMIADAGFVLEQSVRLYDRAMGDQAVEVDVIDKVKQDDGSTVSRLRTLTQRLYNPGIARQALELIGRHTSIQAFQDNVEHTHTHKLEQALARRGKQVEERAHANGDIDGVAHQVPDSEIPALPPGEQKRGCIEAEVIEEGHAEPDRNALAAAGAPGK